MKKIFTLIGIVCVGLSLTACSSSTTSTTQSTVETKKVDLSTLEGRKAALTDMINEAYAAYEKKDDTAKIAFINKYYSADFLNNVGVNSIDLFKRMYTDTFDSNKKYNAGYKYKFYDDISVVYPIDESNPTSISLTEKDNHILLSPNLKEQQQIPDSIKTGMIPSNKEIIIK